MVLFFKHLFLFLAIWVVAALLNTMVLGCYFLYYPDRNNVPGFTGFFFYSIAAGFVPQVTLGLTTLTVEGLGRKGIPLFRFVLRAALITWSVWMLLLACLFTSFYTPYDWVFFSSQLVSAVTALSIFRSSIIHHD